MWFSHLVRQAEHRTGERQNSGLFLSYKAIAPTWLFYLSLHGCVSPSLIASLSSLYPSCSSYLVPEWLLIFSVSKFSSRCPKVSGKKQGFYSQRKTQNTQFGEQTLEHPHDSCHGIHALWNPPLSVGGNWDWPIKYGKCEEIIAGIIKVSNSWLQVNQKADIPGWASLNQIKALKGRTEFSLRWGTHSPSLFWRIKLPYSEKGGF